MHQATRRMLGEYGKMTSAGVLFVLDEMRRRSPEGLGVGEIETPSTALPPKGKNRR